MSENPKAAGGRDPFRLAVLVSGGGTNLQAIIDRIADGSLGGVSIAAVISTSPGAYALERAEKAGIPGFTVSPKQFGTRADFSAALRAKVDEADPDLIVLAGCLTKIPAALVEAYPNRIINIHPALIPSFSGKGFYGLRVHEAALRRGVRVTGATVHFVSEGLDEGPIILQRAVEIREGDTPEILQRRVMEQAEWEILPEAIRLIAEGRVSVGAEGTVRIRAAGQES